MKKLTFAVAVFAGLSLACGSDLLKQDGIDNKSQFNGTFTLQGKLMNAQTGEPIGGDDLQVKLIQGTSVRDPNRLIRDVKDPLVGEYAFSDIPVTYNYVAVYKLVVIKPGFGRFEAILDDYGADSSDNVLDTVYNYVGNVHLFPLGAEAPAYTVHVAFNGKPVPGAVVYADPSDNNTATDTPNWTLFADPGYAPAISVTTDETGKATFTGDTLSLGVRYSIRVQPVVFEGAQLSQEFAGSFAVGLDSNVHYVSMGNLSPNASSYGLYVDDISNKAEELNANGDLTIHFSRPVRVSDLTDFSAFVGSSGGTAATLDGTTPATATLSADGLTLTLRPNWTTQPAATDRGVYVFFTATATIGVQGYPNTAFTLFGGIPYLDGGNISGQVMVTAN
jgi:hypothetical protein